LYKEGKTVAEIATLRGFSPLTIAGHLATYVGSGELKISEFVAEEKVQQVLDYLSQNASQQLAEILQEFDGNYTYGELQFILQHKKWLERNASFDEL